MISRIVGRFAAWFESDAGTVQSFIVFSGGVLVELIWPRLDPDHFWYLFGCTYWSAFTCNALANSSRRTARENAAYLAEMRALVERIESQERAELKALGVNES